MKQNDFKQYSDYKLYLIRKNLILHKFSSDEIPESIKSYVNDSKIVVGSSHTRAMRCVSLIDNEIVSRFVNNMVVHDNM